MLTRQFLRSAIKVNSTIFNTVTLKNQQRKMSNTPEKPRLSPAIRILIGIAGLPSLALGYMLIFAVLNNGVDGIGAFEVVYSVVGLIAVYIAVTGKRPF